MNKKDKAYVDNQYLMALNKIVAQTGIINTQNKTINDLQDNLRLETNFLNGEIRILEDKIYSLPTTTVKDCKKCGHPTVHLIGTAPLLTRCLNCGTVWETTTKTVTEVKDISKKK
jgi:hypothetical protein